MALERHSQREKDALTHQPAGNIPINEWEPFLARHPDQVFAAYLRRGFTEGFRIGFDCTTRLRKAPQNFRSVQANPATVEQYIEAELAAGRLVESAAPMTRRNPIGIIPKPHQPGRFRLIVDLSAPRGASVNDGISTELSSLVYITVDKAARLVAHCGKGALMAKTDLRSAYRHVPVHRDDQHLLGIEWDGRTFRDTALPFGLRSAPKIFSAVADGLAWALQCEGVNLSVHYLDDFLFWCPPDSPQCAVALDTAVATCTRLGFPIAADKTVGPTTALTFLGIEIDSAAQVLRLPREKLSRLRHLVNTWSSKRNASKRELQVIIGHLGHAAAVVTPGHLFLRNLIEASKRPRSPHHPTRINLKCRADLAWWKILFDEWNGIALFPRFPAGNTVVADASGSWGCGAYCSETSSWFQIQWPKSWEAVNIATKELLPLVAASALWGSSWTGSRIKFLSDNMAVVRCLSSFSAHDPDLTHLLRCLFLLKAKFQFEFCAQHIAGERNTAADALSRNKLPLFHSLCSQPLPRPTEIPGDLRTLLLDRSLTWTSPRWEELFGNSLRTVSQAEQ